MLKNHWNEYTKICLFGQTTKQPLSNFEPWQSWKYKQLWVMGPKPTCLLKKLYWQRTTSFYSEKISDNNNDGNDSKTLSKVILNCMKELTTFTMTFN